MSQNKKKPTSKISKIGNLTTIAGDKLSARINQWVNALTAQGTGQDSRRASYYSATLSPLDDTVLETLYAQNGLAKTIVDRIVEDSLRKTPTFSIESAEADGSSDVVESEGELIDESLLQDWHVIETVLRAAVWGRLYGCGGILLGVNDGKNPREPLEFPVAQGSLEWLEVVDKINLSVSEFYSENDPEVANDKNKIGKPKIYQLSPDSVYGWRSSAQLVHESRFIMFPGQRTSNRVRAYNEYCDLSVLQDKFDTLRDIANTEQAIHQLVQGASQAIYKVRDLHEQVSQDENRILELMRLVDYSRNTGRAIILDSDGEEFEQIGAENLQGVEAFLNLAYKRLSADTRIPLTVLMGQSPAGLNATGESDSRHWYNQVESYQNDVLAPRLQKLMTVILQSEGVLSEDSLLRVNFPTLWEEPEEDKVAVLKTKAETAKILLESGILTVEEVRDWFIND